MQYSANLNYKELIYEAPHLSVGAWQLLTKGTRHFSRLESGRTKRLSYCIVNNLLNTRLFETRKASTSVFLTNSPIWYPTMGVITKGILIIDLALY